MIRSFFGLTEDPFNSKDLTLLPTQQHIHDALCVHNAQGGFCLVMGLPGTGKSVIKDFLLDHLSPRQTLAVTIGRTLHTYTNTTRILCQAFNIEHAASSFTCEKMLIEEAHSLKRQGKNLVIIICPFPHFNHMLSEKIPKLTSKNRKFRQPEFGKIGPFSPKGLCEVKAEEILQTTRGFPGILSPNQIRSLSELSKNRLPYSARLFIWI